MRNFNSKNPFDPFIFNQIQDLKNSISKTLKEFINSLEIPFHQKILLLETTTEIFDNLINRLELGDISIGKSLSNKRICALMLYTAIISNDNIEDFFISDKIYELADGYWNLSGPYNFYFAEFYPRKREFPIFESKLSILGDVKYNLIRYFSGILIKNLEIDIPEYIQLFESKFINDELPYEFTTEDRSNLIQFHSKNVLDFTKFFTDIISIIKLLIITSSNYKKIGVSMPLKYLCEFAKNNNINFLTTSLATIYYTVKEIYQILLDSNPNYYPTLVRDSGNNRSLASKKLKLYAMKNLYNGQFCYNGIIKCPLCQKQLFCTNTDIIRLNALEFHHEDSKKKENSFTGMKLYQLFIADQHKSDVLEKIIEIMEFEGVSVECRSHHRLKKAKIFRYFKYLINWEGLFDLDPEIIHILIKTSINNFCCTKNLTDSQKNIVKLSIVRFLKKKYIIDSFYGTHCHTCGEFNTIDHLPAFDLHHCDKNEKEEKQEFRELIDRPLEEVIYFIKKEGGGFICTNCHTVIHRRYELLNEVYNNDKAVLDKIYWDYNRVIEHFTPIQNFFIENSLESPIRITEAIISHLTALYELSKQQTEITSQDLAIYLNQESRSIRNWFVRDVNKDFLEKCVNINFGTTGYGARPNTYQLTSYGIKVSELIYHFKQYYDDLKI